MWSEHCSYKHSKALLRRFPTDGPRVLLGAGEENAGAVDIGDGLAIVMKVESHNHPSAVEPFQGAATGVGGILRDIFTMGARPIALLDSLRFGALDSARSRHLANGIIGGIGWYGNCVGVPTVGGEVAVSAAYDGNPLVNAMCVGIMRHEDLRRSAARGVGNPVILFGADTGRDGVHGATFASLTDPGESHRGVVQVGDPFLEKLLIEACLELRADPALVGLQDLGATGLTSATVEAAARAGSGIAIDVDLVPRRAEAMAPYEVMLSESQERMLAVVEAGSEERVMAGLRRAGLHAAVIGRVTDSGSLEVHAAGEQVADLPIALLTDVPPIPLEPARPASLDWRDAREASVVPAPADLDGRLPAASRRPGSSRAGRPSSRRTTTWSAPIRSSRPAAMPRSFASRDRRAGIALATDGNGRLCFLDPRVGGAIAVAEAARNVSCTGALPIAVTDCLNFGSPEDPTVAWQMGEVIDGMAEACRAFGTPVVSGNVSLYNDSRGMPIWPTPVVGMLGLLDDVERRCDIGFRGAGRRRRPPRRDARRPRREHVSRGAPWAHRRPAVDRPRPRGGRPGARPGAHRRRARAFGARLQRWGPRGRDRGVRVPRWRRRGLPGPAGRTRTARRALRRDPVADRRQRRSRGLAAGRGACGGRGRAVRPARRDRRRPASGSGRWTCPWTRRAPHGTAASPTPCAGRGPVGR